MKFPLFKMIDSVVQTPSIGAVCTQMVRAAVGQTDATSVLDTRRFHVRSVIVLPSTRLGVGCSGESCSAAVWAPPFQNHVV
jgi:hypothetical protein